MRNLRTEIQAIGWQEVITIGYEHEVPLGTLRMRRVFCQVRLIIRDRSVPTGLPVHQHANVPAVHSNTSHPHSGLRNTIDGQKFMSSATATHRTGLLMALEDL